MPVQSTFRILEELSRIAALGLNELTQRTGISKSTVFRIPTTLHDLDPLLVTVAGTTMSATP